MVYSLQGYEDILNFFFKITAGYLDDAADSEFKKKSKFCLFISGVYINLYKNWQVSFLMSLHNVV